MGEEVIFDDSPMAKYLATLESKPKKVKHKQAFKIEKLDETVFDQKPAFLAQEPQKIASKYSQITNYIALLYNYIKNIDLQFMKNSKIDLKNFESISQKIATIGLQDHEDSKYARYFHDNGNFKSSEIILESYDYQISRIMALFVFAVFFATIFLLFFSKTRLFGYFFGILISPIILLNVFNVFLLKKRHQTLEEIVQNVEKLGKTNLIFCKLIKSSLQSIQEIELVSRGYRISTPLSPIARLEQSAKNRKCQKLRNVIFKSLQNLVKYILQETPTQYHSLYNGIDFLILEATQVSQNNIEKTSIFELKNALSAFLLLKSRFFDYQLEHCIGYLPFDDSENCKQQKSIFSEIKFNSVLKRLLCTLSDCVASFDDIHTTRESWFHFESGETPKKTFFKSDLKTQLFDHLTALQTTLQTSSARVMLCKEHLSCIDQIDSSESVENSETFVEFQRSLNGLLETIRSVHDDVQSCSKLYESVEGAMNRFMRDLDSKSENESKVSTNAFSSPDQTLLETDGLQSTEMNEIPFEDYIKQLASRTGPFQEHVYEAETGDKEDDFRPRSTLTREERIRIAKREREEMNRRENDLVAKLMLVHELKNVLKSRQAEIIPLLNNNHNENPTNSNQPSSNILETLQSSTSM